MAGIKGRDTTPELRVRRALHARGFRFRLHAANLPGRPDIVLPLWRAAIQVHGCFWHRHPGCRLATTPSTNREFWATKFAQTVRRDQRQLRALTESGWRVGVVWECGLREQDIDELVESLAVWIGTAGEDLIELPS